MNVLCRALRPADIEALRLILRLTPEFTPEERPVAEEVLEGCLENPAESGYHGIVAVSGDIPAGFACYGPTPLTSGNWEIYWLAVAPDYRRSGIGSELMTAVENAVRQAGGRQVTLETSSQPSYAGTRRFYRRLGYHETALIPDYYRPGDDLIIYLKKLTGATESGNIPFGPGS